MKRVLVALMILFWSSASAQVNVEQELAALASQRDYFKLKQVFDASKKNLRRPQQLFYGAILSMSLNRSQESNDQISTLIKSGKLKSLGDSVTANVYLMKFFNHFKLFEYQAAYQTGEMIFSQYGKYIPAAQLAGYKNLQDINRILQKAPAQQVTVRDSATLKIHRDKANLLNIPVRAGDSTYTFIFDTGANLSTITETYARKLNLTVYDGLIDVGAMGGMTKARLSVCPQLIIGAAEIKNAIFLVMPDSALDFKAIQYKINAIIGFPVMNGLGEVHFKKGKVMHIPKQLSVYPFQNMMVEGLMPIVQISVNNKPLTFDFDTGAKQTSFYKRFLDDGLADDLTLTDSEARVRGAAGMSVVKSKKVESIDLTTAGRSFTLKGNDIYTTQIRDTFRYGNIGQDFISQYSTLILNFRTMFIAFE
jgi:predicted aspartyl protease